MTTPIVDVTIAVHSETRPIARAVASVLDHTRAPVRVNVVAHNIDPDIIHENLGAYASDDRVRLLPLADGVRSPAGPMNHGFACSEAPFMSLMGSDDELQPGAIDSWLAVQHETGADMVLAKIKLATGRIDPYPPVRGGKRTRKLDGRRDRLAYRSAPLGLISRDRFGDLRLSAGLPSGEDLTYSLTMWFTAAHLAYDMHGPAYVVNADAGDRVTSAPRPIAQDFAYLNELESLPWFARASRADRVAIIAKLVRIHLFDAVLVRADTQEKLECNRDDLLALFARLQRLAPGVLRVLARADRMVFTVIKRRDSSSEQVLRALSARHKYLSIATVLTRNPMYLFHEQAPFRTLLAGYQIMRRG